MFPARDRVPAIDAAAQIVEENMKVKIVGFPVLGLVAWLLAACGGSGRQNSVDVNTKLNPRNAKAAAATALAPVTSGGIHNLILKTSSNSLLHWMAAFGGVNLRN